MRVLVAGAAPFEDLDALWHDHLINLREIRIGFLDRTTRCPRRSPPVLGAWIRAEEVE